MKAESLDIDASCKYIILYRLKSDNSVDICSCSKDDIVEKYEKLNDDSGLEIIGIYERSAYLEEQLDRFYNKAMPWLTDFFSKFDAKARKENTNGNTN